jgi:hypothetical protein
MRRDWDLVRRILINLEEASVPLHADAIEGFDPALVSYHYRILGESGLIEAYCCESDGANACTATRLTWDGHDLLDVIRDESRWEIFRLWAVEHGILLSLHIIKTWSYRAVEKML